MRYFLAFLVNDITAESRVIPLMDRREKSVQQLMSEARGKVQWDDAGVTLVEIDAPPVAQWELCAWVPADLCTRNDAPPMGAEEARLQRLLESSGFQL